jgi:hypothetical protein
MIVAAVKERLVDGAMIAVKAIVIPMATVVLLGVKATVSLVVGIITAVLEYATAVLVGFPAVAAVKQRVRVVVGAPNVVMAIATLMAFVARLGARAMVNLAVGAITVVRDTAVATDSAVKK